MVDVRMLRTSPATRSFWTAADAGSAGISWPHATEYQALHNFISKIIETKKGQGNWQIQGNMIQYLIQHDSTWSNTANQSQHNTVAGEKNKSLGSKPRTCCRSLGSESQASTFSLDAMPEFQLLCGGVGWRSGCSWCSSICCSQTLSCELRVLQYMYF